MNTEQRKGMPSEDDIKAALRHVIDPEVGMNVVDLGLVYGITLSAEQIQITMTMTSQACPMGSMILDEARKQVRSITPPGIGIDMQLVWDPPWSPARMSEHARQRFGWSS